ncbi:MAG: hypothetical protein E8D45_12670 [Nitrospira sp.]|nr:MAG: hypothetical protein E8D45_12670 [Nitrospira sp.]
MISTPGEDVIGLEDDLDKWTSCIRCRGFLVDEVIEEEGRLGPAKRCVHCGDIVDRRILRNRRMSPLPHPGRSRPGIARIILWKTPEENKPDFST